ncbi:hypothetical protein B0H14DRAFT_2794804 [Mycena olivaceomarginata]|nr:hypothetical protein B0H14DRAFT_2794804 [Mycena olivaceomarginata]
MFSMFCRLHRPRWHPSGRRHRRTILGKWRCTVCRDRILLSPYDKTYARSRRTRTTCFRTGMVLAPSRSFEPHAGRHISGRRSPGRARIAGGARWIGCHASQKSEIGRSCPHLTFPHSSLIQIGQSRCPRVTPDPLDPVPRPLSGRRSQRRAKIPGGAGWRVCAPRRYSGMARAFYSLLTLLCRPSAPRTSASATLSSAPLCFWCEGSPPFYSDLSFDPPPPYRHPSVTDDVSFSALFPERNDGFFWFRSSSKHGGQVASKSRKPANSKLCGRRQGVSIIYFILSRTDERLKARPSAPLTALSQC